MDVLGLKCHTKEYLFNLFLWWTFSTLLYKPARNPCKMPAAQHVESYYESCCWNISWNSFCSGGEFNMGGMETWSLSYRVSELQIRVLLKVGCTSLKIVFFSTFHYSRVLQDTDSYKLGLLMVPNNPRSKWLPWQQYLTDINFKYIYLKIEIPTPRDHHRHTKYTTLCLNNI